MRILLLYRVDFIQERVVIQRAWYYFENSISYKFNINHFEYIFFFFFNFLIKVFQKNLKSKLNSHNFNNSVPSLVRRAMHKISLSNAIMLYFQIKLFIASMHLLTWPVGCDLANSITNTSQNERKCAVWKKNYQLNTYRLKSRSRNGIHLKIINILFWPLSIIYL